MLSGWGAAFPGRLARVARRGRRGRDTHHGARWVSLSPDTAHRGPGRPALAVVAIPAKTSPRPARQRHAPGQTGGHLRPRLENTAPHNAPAHVVVIRDGHSVSAGWARTSAGSRVEAVARRHRTQGRPRIVHHPRGRAMARDGRPRARDPHGRRAGGNPTSTTSSSRDTPLTIDVSERPGPCCRSGWSWSGCRWFAGVPLDRGWSRRAQLPAPVAASFGVAR
jgi:hypothetical protein